VQVQRWVVVIHPEGSNEWEKLGRKMTWLYTLNHLEELDAATHRIAGKIRDGDVMKADDIKEFRNALVAVQTVIEEGVSLLVDDVEPYQGALYHVLYGVFADSLDIPIDRLDELDCKGCENDA